MIPYSDGFARPLVTPSHSGISFSLQLMFEPSFCTIAYFLPAATIPNEYPTVIISNVS